MSGSVSQIREVNNQSSYLSQNSLTQHFGLAKYNKIDTLEIRWPSGLIQSFQNISINKRILITEGINNIKYLETHPN